MMNTSQNGFWRPENDFITNVNVVSNQLWNNKIDISERDERVIDDLRYFLVSKNIISKIQKSFYGIIDLPKNPLYGRYASARLFAAGNQCVPCQDVDEGKCDNGEFKTEDELAENYYDTICEISIEKIDNQRWPSVLKHLTKKPTLQNPKLTQINGQLQVAPRQVSVVNLNYYRKPKDATFVYTLSEPNLQNGSGDVIIYNKEASQPLEWPETCKNELLEMLKEMYLLYTRDSQGTQINSAQKQLNP